MTMLRTVAFMLACILVLPYVLLNGIGAGGGAGTGANNIRSGSPRPAAVDPSAVPHESLDRRRLLDLARTTRTRERRHISAVFDPDTLGPKRVVRFDTVIAFEALLKPGETPPPQTLHALFAEARASGYMMRECANLLQSFADLCAVSQSRAEDLGGGIWRLSADLAFTPLDPIGKIPRARDLEYTPWRSRLRAGLRTPRADLPRHRLEFYRRARAVCTAIRRTAGNCIIETLQFSVSEAPDHPDLVILTARAKFATLGATTDQLEGAPGTSPDAPDAAPDPRPGPDTLPLDQPLLNVRHERLSHPPPPAQTALFQGD